MHQSVIHGASNSDLYVVNLGYIISKNLNISLEERNKQGIFVLKYFLFIYFYFYKYL